MRKMATNIIWICQSSRTNCVLLNLQEVGAKIKKYPV